MRPLHHAVIAGSLAYTGGCPPELTAALSCVSAGLCWLPASMRRVTHHAVLWGAVLLATVVAERTVVQHSPVPLWVPPLGALLHLVGDMFAVGEGVVLFGRNPFSLDVVRKGTWGEHALTLCLSLLFVLSPDSLLHLVALGQIHGRAIAVIGVSICVAYCYDRYTLHPLAQPMVIDMATLSLRARVWPPEHEESSDPAPDQASGSVVDPEAWDMSVPAEVGGWHSELLATFERDVVRPWLQTAEIVIEREFAPYIYEVMRYLDSHADAPSVNHCPNKGAGDQLYAMLSQVSLIEHSLHVVHASLKLGAGLVPENRMRAYQGGLILAGLVHDVGKIRDLWPHDGEYVNDEHPATSGHYLQTLIGRLAPLPELLKSRMEQIMLAVCHHHAKACPGETTWYYDVLRRADVQAREAEVQRCRGDAPHAEHSETLAIPPEVGLDRIVARLRAYANYVHPIQHSYWKSCSQPDGYVYYCVDIYHEAIREAVSSCETASSLYAWVQDDDATLRHARGTCVYQAIRERGWAHPHIGAGYHSNVFQVRHAGTGRTWSLRMIPVSCEAFGVSIETMEQARQDIPVLAQLTILAQASSPKQ